MAYLSIVFSGIRGRSPEQRQQNLINELITFSDTSEMYSITRGLENLPVACREKQ